MTRFPVSPQAHRPLWQTLLAPMLLASLGLHGLLLLLPVASSDEAAIPPPDPEQDNIAITRIPPAAIDTAPLSPAGVVATAPAAAVQPQSGAAPSPPAGSPGAAAAARQAVPAQSSPPLPLNSAAATAPPRAALPSLPGRGKDAAPPAGVTPPNPGVPRPDPTIAPLGQARREEMLAYVASLDLPQARMDQLAAVIWQRYGYSRQDTSRGEYTDNLSQWQDQIRQDTGQPDLTAEEDRTDFAVSFQRRACLSTPPGDIKVGFVVNPDGSFRQEPLLLRSSGYAELNQKALDRLRQYEPPGADRLKAYTVTVETAVDYGGQDCLAAPQQPSDTSAET